jgi:hypothetical protein
MVNVKTRALMCVRGIKSYYNMSVSILRACLKREMSMRGRSDLLGNADDAIHPKNTDYFQLKHMLQCIQSKWSEMEISREREMF